MLDPDKNKPLTGKELLERRERLRIKRNGYESIWKQCEEVLEFLDVGLYETNESTKPIDKPLRFDSIAQQSLNDYASGWTHSMIPDNERWFETKKVKFGFNTPRATQLKLEKVSDLIYDWFSNGKTKFNSSMFTAFYSKGSVGTGIIYVDWIPERQIPFFKFFPVGHFVLDCNEMGEIDTVFRDVFLSGRHVIKKFGRENLSGDILKEVDSKPDDTRKVIHYVAPNENAGRLGLFNTNKKFVSIWIDEKTKEIVRESGFDMMPYFFTRGKVLTNIPWGFSPFMEVLPEINKLNSYEKYGEQALQLNIAPPYAFPDDDSMNEPVLDPLGITLVDPDASYKPQRLIDHIPMGESEQKIDQTRQAIKEAMFNDAFKFLMNFRKKERQTTTEIEEIQDERLRRISPASRQDNEEFLDPIIRYVYHLAKNNLPNDHFIHELDDDEEDFDIKFKSPASLIQARIKSNNTQRWLLGTILPMAESEPSIRDVVNLENYVRRDAQVQNIYADTVNTEQETEDIRKGRRQQQENEMLMANAPAMGSAMKDIAKASKDAPQLFGS